MDFIDQKIQELEGLAAEFTAEFLSLTPAEMDVKPGEKDWSINECLDHLIRTGVSYHGTLDAVAGRKYQRNAWTRLPLLPAFWGKMILKAVSPSTTGKSKTFPVWLPTSSRYGRNLTGELAAENANVAGKLNKLKDTDLDRMIISSPAGAFVTYSLRDCIIILVEHEKRHFNQAKRVKDGLVKARASVAKA